MSPPSGSVYTMIGNLDVEIPDVAEPIRGFRGFEVETTSELGRDLIFLKSFNGTIWPPNGTGKRRVHYADHITARCTGLLGQLHGGTEAHKCPSPPSLKHLHMGSGCGIYAFKDIKDLAKGFPLWGMPTDNPVFLIRVWGVIEMWGHVYDHEKGYRAEHAQLKELLYVPGYGLPFDRMQAIAESYGVELVTMDNIDLGWVAKQQEARRAFAVKADPLLMLTLYIYTCCRIAWDGLKNQARKIWRSIRG